MIKQIRCPENLGDVLDMLDPEEFNEALEAEYEFIAELKRISSPEAVQAYKTTERSVGFIMSCGKTFEEVRGALKAHVSGCQKCRIEYARYRDGDVEKQLKMAEELSHSRKEGLRLYGQVELEEGYLALIKETDPLGIDTQ